MSAPLDASRAAEVLHREAHALDERRWDDWLAMYAEDAVFWVPAWRDEDTLVASADDELSLIWCGARAGLEDRVWRVRSGLSMASDALPRTAHLVSNVVVEDADAEHACVRAMFACHLYEPRRARQHVYFGRYEYRLSAPGDAPWRIAEKKVVLMNDRIPTMLDFYCV